jgi:hypothetical protein
METHVQEMESQLKRWGAKLDELVAKVDEVGAEVKRDYRQRLDDLRSRHQVAQSKLAALKAAGFEKWEIFRAGLESTLGELEASFKKLTS